MFKGLGKQKNPYFQFPIDFPIVLFPNLFLCVALNIKSKGRLSWWFGDIWPILCISLDKQRCCDSNLRASAAVLKLVASKHFPFKHGFSLDEWSFFPLSMQSKIQARPGIQLTVFWGRGVLCAQKWFIF